MSNIDLGAITADRLLNDSILKDQLAADVILAASGSARLNNPAVVRSVDTRGDLEIDIPGVGAVDIHEGVPEGQKVAITNSKFFVNTLNLEKDTAILTLTDEAIIRTNAQGFPAWTYMQEQAQRRLAALQDKRIVAALATTPQVGESINLKTGNFYDALAEAEGKMGDYEITSVVCSREARMHIYRNTNASAYTGSNPAAPYDNNMIPGTGIPIFTSTAVTGNNIYFVSTEVPGAVWGTGQVATHVWRDEDGDKLLMRIDAYRGALSNLQQTSDTNKNIGVVETPWTFA